MHAHFRTPMRLCPRSSVGTGDPPALVWSTAPCLLIVLSELLLYFEVSDPSYIHLLSANYLHKFYLLGLGETASRRGLLAGYLRRLGLNNRPGFPGVRLEWDLAVTLGSPQERVLCSFREVTLLNSLGTCFKYKIYLCEYIQ